MGSEAHGLVRGGRAHVRQLLGLGHVHVHVRRARVLAHDHALVDGRARSHEQLPALLEVVQGVGGRVAGTVGHENARGPPCDLALPVDPAVEEAVEHGRAPRVRHQLRPHPDEAAGGHVELEAHAPGAVVHHAHHLALAHGHLLEHHAHVGLGHVDHEQLQGLLALSVLQVR